MTKIRKVRFGFYILKYNPLFTHNMTSMALPSLPKSVLDSFGGQVQQSLAPDVSAMQDESLTSDEKRDVLFKHVRSLTKSIVKIQFAVRIGDTCGVDSVIQECRDIIATVLQLIGSDPTKREGQLAQAIEKFTEVCMVQQFFATGRLASPSALQPCNDEEYIGAALGFAQELSRYVVGRASEGDEASIRICQSIIVQLNSKMLEFDFRNGPLRRKYDGLKYALKGVEDVLYELSLLHKDGPAVVTESTELPDSKRKRSEGNGDGSGAGASSSMEALTDINPLIDGAELDAIRARMDAYDKLREDVIKQSRDVQKFAKQAIFAVHRGTLEEAQKKLDEAKRIALLILSTISEQPALRAGSLSNSLEEWAEGAMTLEWVRSSRIMTRSDMPFVNTNEYVGALSDFTGEIGRLAVAAASKRDLVSVRRVLQADVAIYAGLMQVNVGGKYTKKCEAVATNLKKVEDVVYELSMLQRGARSVGPREDPPAPGKDEAGDD